MGLRDSDDIGGGMGHQQIYDLQQERTALRALVAEAMNHIADPGWVKRAAAILACKHCKGTGKVLEHLCPVCNPTTSPPPSSFGRSTP